MSRGTWFLLFPVFHACTRWLQQGRASGGVFLSLLVLVGCRILSEGFPAGGVHARRHVHVVYPRLMVHVPIEAASFATIFVLKLCIIC